MRPTPMAATPLLLAEDLGNLARGSARSALILLLVASGACGNPDPDAIVSTERPRARSEARAATYDDGEQILLFGGYQAPADEAAGSGEFLDDSWRFEPGQGWTQVAALERPSARALYALDVDEQRGRALLFGGRWRPAGQTGVYTLYDDLWQFEFATGAWTLLDDGERGPAPRYHSWGAYHAGADRFYVWGGDTSPDPRDPALTDQLWSWDGLDWTRIPTSGDKPSLRISLGVLHDTTRNRIVIFGGQTTDVEDVRDETFALDLDNFVWTALDGGEGAAPSGRLNPHLAYDAGNDRYLLFGGRGSVGDTNDLWAMNPDSGAWTELGLGDALTGELGCLGNPSDIPASFVEPDFSAPERRQNGTMAVLDRSLWLFGGLQGECATNLDDTWRYDLRDDTWVELIEATSGESCARRQDDCQCLCF